MIWAECNSAPCILLKNFGFVKISKLICFYLKKENFPNCAVKIYSIFFYHPRSMLSTSISLFYDLIRIPNPIAWILNIFNILNNSFRIRIIIKKHQKCCHFVKRFTFSHSHNYCKQKVSQQINLASPGLNK